MMRDVLQRGIRSLVVFCPPGIIIGVLAAITITMTMTTTIGVGTGGFVLPAPVLAEPSMGQFLIPSRYFEETGHNVGGPFLAFYESHEAIFGAPITEVLEEQGVLVQYFQYGRLEMPLQSSAQVRITPLGSLLMRHRSGEPAFARHEAGPAEVSTYFPSTGHNLSHAFRPFWQRHGGHPVFGAPISEAFIEPDTPEVPRSTVQYFEHARLHYRLDHPGAPPAIWLGPLGADYAQQQGVSPQALAPSRPLVILGTATMDFGSSPSYARNIRLAARQFERLKISPGEEVSFLAVVGELSPRTGYVEGGGIVNGRIGQVIAGGICYLSTAIYRAVLEVGLEVTERHSHSLAVPGFTDPPNMDSAVFMHDGRGYENPYDVDLRWRNTTPDSLLLTTEIVTRQLTVSIWGYRNDHDYDHDHDQATAPDDDNPEAGAGHHSR
ncbi:MAG: VanW family protein [Chloroflexaceae bacterium]|nr:VanW family protein [Chloroflexaceae bacterium]